MSCQILLGDIAFSASQPYFRLERGPGVRALPINKVTPDSVRTGVRGIVIPSFEDCERGESLSRFAFKDSEGCLAR